MLAPRPSAASRCLITCVGPGRQAAALVGVAPFSRDSGTMRGRRAIRGGRAALRACLHVATVAAARGSDPAIAGFHRRLRAAGKPAKLRLTACVRKPVATLDAIPPARVGASLGRRQGFAGTTQRSARCSAGLAVRVRL